MTRPWQTISFFAFARDCNFQTLDYRFDQILKNRFNFQCHPSRKNLESFSSNRGYIENMFFDEEYVVPLIFNMLSLQKLEFDVSNNWFYSFLSRRNFIWSGTRESGKILLAPNSMNIYILHAHFFITYKHYKVVEGKSSLQFINSLKHAANPAVLPRHGGKSRSSKWYFQDVFKWSRF